MKRLAFAVMAAPLLAWPAGSETGLASGTAHARVVSGNAGYGALRTGVDTEWHAADEGLTPYASAGWAFDAFQSRFGVTGGSWVRIGPETKARGGLGLETARDRETGEHAGAVVVEAGVEGDLRSPILGADYRLSAGRAGGSRVVGPAWRPRRLGSDRRTAVHDLSGHVAAPFGAAWLSARVGLQRAGRDGGSVHETAALAFPVTSAISGEAGITFIQGDAEGTYVSLGALWHFW
jgi:hypothetical protein